MRFFLVLCLVHGPEDPGLFQAGKRRGDMTEFNSIIARNAHIWPDKLALVDSTSKKTWKEVDTRIKSLANALLGLGLVKGDRLAIISQNCNQVVEFGYAVPRAGLIASFVNWRLLPEQIQVLINDLRPRAVVVQDEYASVMDSIRSELKGVEIFIGLGSGHRYSYDYEKLIEDSPANEPQVKVSEDALCHIVYTSGTTGWVKGACLTHRTMMARTYQETEICCRGFQEVGLLFAVLFTVGPWYLVLSSVFVGATIVLRGATAEDYVNALEEERATWTTCTEIKYKRVKEYLESSGREYNFSSLRILATGGGRNYPPWLLKEMSEFFGVPIADKQYAGTEFGAPIYLAAKDISAGLSRSADDKAKQRLESIGKAGIFGAKVRITDKDGNEVAPGEIGEIMVTGEGVMKEYWNNPELTRKSFRDGWYHTNDLAKTDEDGYIYFAGRLDNMIKTGGFSVYPEEVERVIALHEAVGNVSVFGIEDETWGSAVTAAVELKEGYEATDREIKDFCRLHLTGFQVPKDVFFLPELPWHAGQHKVSISDLKRIAKERKERLLT